MITTETVIEKEKRQQYSHNDPWTAANESLVISPLQSCTSCTAPMPHHRCKAACNEIHNTTNSTWEQTVLDIAFTNYLLGAVNNTAILMMGDSLSWQISHAMSCYTSHPAINITVDFEAMHQFPLDHQSFQTKLENLFTRKTYAAVVFGLGTWYNLNQPEDWSNANKTSCPTMSMSNSETTSNTTMKIFEHCCPKSLHRYYAKENDAYKQAGQVQIQCPDLLRRTSFISGLQRLVEVMNRDQNRNWPRFIWKEVPPQHFDTLVGDGMFVIGAPGASRSCAPIKKKDGAYERNEIANAILLANNSQTEESPRMISWVSTWIKTWFNGRCTRVEIAPTFAILRLLLGDGSLRF